MGKSAILSERARSKVDDRLRQLRRQGSPLLQGELATRLGKSATHLSKVLNGAEPATYELIVNLAGILGLRPGDLWTDLPDWASRLEELFERRFRILSIEDQMPVVQPTGSRYTISTRARTIEQQALRQAGASDQPLAIVPFSEASKGNFEREPDGALVLRYDTGRWSQLTAMRRSNEPCYDIYVGAVLMTSGLQLLFHRRSDRVRTYKNVFASHGGSFNPPDPTRRDVFGHDLDLREAVQRELWEETKSRQIELKFDQEILVMLEEDFTPDGRQHSVQVIALNATFPTADVKSALALPLEEGISHAVPFDPSNLEVLKHQLLHEQWAPCGLAHYLIWLVRGGPGLPDHYRQYAKVLFEEILAEMARRGSWRAA